MKNTHLTILTGVLTTLGLALIAYKIVALDFPLTPQAQTSLWSIEAGLVFEANAKPVTVDLYLPSSSARHFIANENFIAKGYGVEVSADNGKRRANWTIRKAEGRRRLF
jgi:hypothetical protein